MSWDMVKNAGQAAWAVIKDGDPSAEVATSSANAARGFTICSIARLRIDCTSRANGRRAGVHLNCNSRR